MTLLLAKLTFPKTQSIKKALLAGVHSRYMSAKFIACRQRLVQPMFNIGDLKSFPPEKFFFSIFIIF